MIKMKDVNEYKNKVNRKKFDEIHSKNTYKGSSSYFPLELLENSLMKCENPKIIASPISVLKIAREYEYGNHNFERRLIHLLKYPEDTSSFEYNRADLKNRILWFYGLQIPLVIVNDLEDENIFGIIGESANDTYLFWIF